MKKAMKVVKQLGSINISFDVGEVVEAEKIGDYFKITPFGKSGPSIAGVPAHYLEELNPDFVSSGPFRNVI